tara:strand:- start:52 stop:828 length:777 start_codon:yes stop_codon:yes gene_type:complete
MNKSIHYLLLIALTLLSSCYITTSSGTVGVFKIVKGNGNITTKTHTTSDYHKVNVVGSMDVILEKGTEGTIRVTTDENIHEYVTIESNNGILNIKIKNHVNINTKKSIRIKVPFTSLDNVSLTGSGYVLTNDKIKSDQFEAKISGSGNMNLDIDVNRVDAKVIGSGDLKILGTATDLKIKVTGSGDFDGECLISQNVEANVTGSGEAEVVAKTSIKAMVTGSGYIEYLGTPSTIDNKVIGSGDIEAESVILVGLKKGC